MIPTSTTERSPLAGGIAPRSIRRHRGLLRRVVLTWRLLSRKTRRQPPGSDHLRHDLGLLPLERPWGPWDYL